MNKTYKCECGKEFDNPQRFNGHKSRCIIHLKAVGKYDSWLERESILIQKRTKSIICTMCSKKNDSIKQWIDEKHTCERCGKVMTEKYGSGRFCCRRCANSHDVTDSHKEKTSESLIVYHKNNPLKTSSRTKSINIAVCPICGKEFEQNTGHKKQTCGNKQCVNALLSKKQKEAYNEGRNFGWMRRNNLSYAEKFWKTVLDNNGIQYEHDYAVKCENTHYLLDFKIGNNIDLEIDGKQHKYKDRAEHDIERDKRLNEQGFLVYRIPFVNPKNSSDVKKQIDDFLIWYKNNIQ